MVLAIDNGSHSLKYGTAGDENPEIVPSRSNGVVIRRGVIEDWEKMEQMWGDFLAPQVPEIDCVLITEPP